MVVDFYNQKIQVDKDQVLFYGLYNQTIPRRSWLNDNKTLLLSTPQGGSVHTFAIDTGNKSLNYLTNKNNEYVLF